MEKSYEIQPPPLMRRYLMKENVFNSGRPLRALSLYSMFDGSRQGVFWLVGGNKKKTHSFAFVEEKKLFNHSMSEEKKDPTYILKNRFY